MRTGLMLAFSLLMSVLLYACASQPKDLFPPDPNETSKTIYLVSHGWHAGIVIKRGDIPSDVWPQHNDFPEAEYLEVGWGDKDYYMTRSPNMGITLKAGLWPTASVLHIVAFSGSVSRYFPYSEVIRVDLSEKGFKQLCIYIENSYAIDAAGLIQSIGPALYGEGRFYLSHESYHAFNTCNVWTAKALREAGCPITPAENLTVETLMANVATFGKVLQAAPVP